MKPTRLLLIWLAVLLGIGIALGTLRALELAVPSSLSSINWGLLMALLALVLLDAIRVKRLPSPHVRRHLPGSLGQHRPIAPLIQGGALTSVEWIDRPEPTPWIGGHRHQHPLQSSR